MRGNGLWEHRRWALVFCLLLWATAGLFPAATAAAETPTSITRDGDVTLYAEASKSLVRVAESFALTLRVEAPRGTVVAFPSLSEQLGEWDVLDIHDALDVPNGNRRTWTRTITLETIQTGDFEIPEVQVSWTSGTANKTIRTLSTTPLTIRVMSVLEDHADPSQFRDIADVVDVPVPPKQSYKWLGWTAAGVSGTALSVLAAVTLVRRRRQISPEQWALRELAELETSSDALDAGETSGAHLIELAAVLRHYLQLQFGIAAPLLTSDEILGQLRRLRLLDEDDVERIGRVLVTADQSKFAGLQLVSDHLRTLLADVREVVQASARTV